MRRIFNLKLAVLILLVLFSFQLHAKDSLELKGLSEVLPSGWKYEVVDGGSFSKQCISTCIEGVAQFVILFTCPELEYKTELLNRGNPTGKCFTVISYFALYYFDKWDTVRWAEFNECKKSIRPMEAISPPSLFLETDDYTIFYSGGFIDRDKYDLFQPHDLQNCPSNSEVLQLIKGILEEYFQEKNR